MKLSPEVIEKLKDPVFFTETFGTVKGHDFKFYDPNDPTQDRRHLYEIYRDDHPRIILVAGRQVEKSETITRKIIHNAFTQPYRTSTYVAPRYEQATRFSSDRFLNALKQSKGGILMQSIDKQTVTHYKFKNHHQLYIGSAWNDGDSLRGISGDFILFDEMQDIEEGSYSTLVETLSHSEVVTTVKINGKDTRLRGKVLMAGTPKQTGTLYERFWELSDKRVWDRKQQKWIPTQDPEKCLFRGYLLSQTMMPWITEEEIEYKRRTYDEMKFANEVLGEFYSGLLKPLTIEMIKPCLDPSKAFWSKAPAGRECFLGIDWGGGTSAYTVVTILSQNPITDKIELVYVDRFQEMHIPTQVEMIHKLIERFNVKGVVADSGFGAMQIQMLQDYWGNMVKSAFYVVGSREPELIRENDDGTQLVIDRNYQLFETIDLFKERKIEIPYAYPALLDDVVFKHYTCVEAKPVTPTSGKTGYISLIKPSGANDDALHSLNYARIALEYGTRQLDYELGDRREFDLDYLLDIESRLF